MIFFHARMRNGNNVQIGMQMGPRQMIIVGALTFDPGRCFGCNANPPTLIRMNRTQVLAAHLASMPEQKLVSTVWVMNLLTSD